MRPVPIAMVAEGASAQVLPDTPDDIDLSVVVPVKDEQDNLAILMAELLGVLAALPLKSEVVVVDDGSRDRTWDVLCELGVQDQRVRGLRLRRNFGKTAALLAGFTHSYGQIIVTMDGDLQDNPQELPRFLATLETGYDLVTGWKWPRHDPWHKTFPSRIFNAVVSALTGVAVHDVNCGYKAYRGELARSLKLYADMHRFTPVLAAAQGFRVSEIRIQHRPRRFGRSKYGLSRLIRGIFDVMTVLFLTKFMQRPLHLFGTAGMLSLLPGLAIDAYLTVLRLQGEHIGGRPLLMLGVLMVIAGIQLISTGLLGEMLRHVTYRPAEEYAIRERIG